MTATLGVLYALSGAFFELHSFPLNTEAPSEPLTFFVNADQDANADLAILEGRNLTVATQRGVYEVVLPENTSVFDVTDVAGDPLSEVVAFVGTEAIAMPLSGGEPKRLFEAESLWSRAAFDPRPAVLAVQHEGGKAIALPTSEGWELRSTNGFVTATTPYESVDRSFSYGAAGNCGTTASLELTFHLGATYQAGVGLEAGDEPRTLVADAALASPAALRNAVAEPPGAWPHFLVRRDAESRKATRAYCAVDESLTTLVRIAQFATDPEGLPAAAIEPGPARRYAGALAATSWNLVPDFNNDGYADLILWNAPQPGISVDALLRTVTARDWPITLAVHLFSPEKGRFEPAVATALTTRIPVSWFLSGGLPLRCMVLEDFNGDMKTDLGMCTEDSEFSIWLYSDGFAPNADEKHRFAEKIADVELVGNAKTDGRSSIVLRGEKHIFALYAATNRRNVGR